jgi:hypothetical protein
MIQSLINKSFNIFYSNELNESFNFSRVFRVDLVFQKIFVIASQSIFYDRHDFEFVYFDFAKLFEDNRDDWIDWLNILDLDVVSKIHNNSLIFLFLSVMFDTRKNLSIALFRIKKFFWYFFSNMIKRWRRERLFKQDWRKFTSF